MIPRPPPLPLWQQPPAQRHSQTSIAAADAIRPDLNRLERLVLRAIQAAQDGLTDEAGCDATGLSGSCYRPRRVALVERGMVRDSGRTRAGKSGRQMTVWISVEPDA